MPETTPEQHFLQYHLNLLNAFIDQAQLVPPFNQEDCRDEDREFLHTLRALLTDSADPDFLPRGQTLMCQIVAQYPQLMPLLYRDLLWFFGGDCLHFMPDEEIAAFQRLDELRYEAASTDKAFSYEEARAHIMGLH